jgi:hypothetical protein
MRELLDVSFLGFGAGKLVVDCNIPPNPILADFNEIKVQVVKGLIFE